jgi:hypothetical protein
VTPEETRTAQGQDVAELDDAELEAALAQALVDLKAATEARRRLPPRSPEVVDAVRRERKVMERIERLLIPFRRDRS